MKKRILIALILVVGIGAIAMRFTWIRAWRATLTLDGQSVTMARVYRNWSGDVLIDLRLASGDLYVIRKSSNTVGVPNSSFLIEGPAFLLARQQPLPCVDMRSAKAGGIDPDLAVSARSLSFRAMDGKTVLISD